MAGTYNRTATLELASGDSGETWQFDPVSGPNTAVLDGGATGGSGGIYAMIGFDQDSFVQNITINGLKLQNYQQLGIWSVNTGNPPVTADNIVITNCEIADDTGNNQSGSTPSTGIVFDNVKNTSVTHCYFHDLGGSAVTFFAFDSGDVLVNNLIDSNVILRVLLRSADMGAISGNGRGGYQAPQAGAAVTCTNNFVRDTGSLAAKSAGLDSVNAPVDDIYIDDQSTGWLISGNVFGPPNPTICNTSQSSMLYQGFFNNGGNNNTVVNNIFDLGDTPYAFLAAWSSEEGPQGPVWNNQVFEKNVVIMNYAGDNMASGFGISGVAYMNGGAPLVASDYTIQNNFYFNYGGGQVLTNGMTASDSSPIIADPMFVNAPDNVTYAFSASSPVHGSPTNFPAIKGGWGPPGFTIPASTLGAGPSYPN
jgi:hypothetical protein